ncbi:MAG TPA: AAA family ATPase [Firmicutes bacterium]|nr:AAA family ATPase [Bacillota bacterium]
MDKRKWPWRETALGAGLAFLTYLVVQGVDLTALILLGGAFLVLWVVGEGKGLPGGLSTGRRFGVVAGAGQAAISPVTFADIGGQEMAKREFLEALDFIRQADQVRRLGIRPLKGILLSGPPGTGKTLLAKAAANYTDSVFVAASGSEFIEMYAGVGAQRVRQLFQKARTLARQQGKRNATVFIDEIDVLGGRRGQTAGHHEYDQTLNQLLVEMDGISARDAVRVLVVAATNRIDILDPALLRPGRFDRVVKVDLPDREGRLHILKLHARGKPLAPDVDLDAVARETFGFSGAHLESVLNEAAILVWRAGRTHITMEDLHEAVEKVMMGEKLDRRPGEGERERIAYHETGHALVSEILQPGSVQAVTVTSRGQALGYMRQAPRDDQYLYTKQELLDQIAVCVAGAAAEEIFFGSRSTGSASDFQQAVKLAKQLVLAGMSDLGVVSEETLPGRLLHETQGRLIEEQVQRARQIIAERREGVVKVVAQLTERERIGGDEFRAALALPPAA